MTGWWRRPFDATHLALVVLVGAGCNAIFGVDDLTYDGVGGAAATGVGGSDPQGGRGGMPAMGGMGGGGGEAPVLWWDDGFERRVRIDIDVNALGAEVVDVPVFVRLDDGVIDTSAVLANADDLRFLDATQQVVFDHEVVTWIDQVGGNVWVRVSQMDATQDHIWLYYANTTAPPVGGNVFDAFQMVHHFETETAGVTPDVVGGLDGTLVGSATLAPGIVGSGVNLAVLGGEVMMDDVAELEPGPGAVRSLSMWLQTTTSGQQPIWVKETGCRGWTLELTAANTLRGDLRTSNTNCAGHANFFAASSVPVVNDGAWHHVAFIVDRQLDVLTLVVDGRVRDSSNIADNAPADRGFAHLGRNPFNPDPSFIGLFDELWVSNVAPAEAWFAAVYLNGTGALLSFAADESR